MNVLLTLLWMAVEIADAVIMFDGFARRRAVGPQTLLVPVVWILSAVWLFVFPGTFFWKILLILLEFSLVYTFLFQDGSGLPFRLCLALIYYGITCNLDNLVTTFLFAYLDENWSYDEADWQSVLLGAAVRLLSTAVILGLHRFRKRSKARSVPWQWYSFPAGVSLLTVRMCYYLGDYYRAGRLEAEVLFICALFLLTMELISVVMISWMEQNAQARQEALNLNTQVRAQAQGIEALSASYAAQRRQTHDFRAHMAVLAELLANNQPERAAAYVAGLQQTQSERVLPVNTHNGTMDALLNQKADAARRCGSDIQFEVSDLSALCIHPPDLTVLVSNLLDNAMEAGLALPAEERRIQVKALLNGDDFFFSVRNRSGPVVIPRNGLPASTKPDPELHGYGLQNVVTILRKYRALYDLNWEDGWFQFVTELPNTVPRSPEK